MEDIRSDSEVALVQSQTPALVDKANKLQITDELSSKLANDILVGLKDFQKKMEVRRVFFVKPIQDHVKNINTEFKKLSEPLADAYAIVREKLTTWCVALEKRKAEAEAKVREAKDKKSAAAADFFDEEAPPPAEIVKPSAGVQSSLGKTHTRKVWTFDIEDKAKVPDTFKSIDEPKINAMIKAHTQTIKGVSGCDLEIPGVKIFQKTVLAVR